MHILACIIIFIIGSVGDALNGNMEGVSAIGSVLVPIGLFFLIISGFSTEYSGTIFLISILMVIIGLILAMKQ